MIIATVIVARSILAGLRKQGRLLDVNVKNTARRNGMTLSVSEEEPPRPGEPYELTVNMPLLERIYPRPHCIVRLSKAIAVALAVFSFGTRCFALADSASPSFRGEWTQYQSAPNHNAVFQGSLDAKWQYSATGRVNGGLAFVDGVIYFGTFEHDVIALDAAQGRQLWSTHLQNVVMSTPVVVGGLVIVGTGTNQVQRDEGEDTLWGTGHGDVVTALNAKTGKQVWEFQTVGEDMPSAALAGSVLIFGNGDMHAYAIDASTGRQVWQAPIPGVATMSSTAWDGTEAVTLASRGLAYTFRPDHTHTVAFNSHGEMLWSEPYGNSDCSPTLADGKVFVEGTSDVMVSSKGNWNWRGRNTVSALDARTGRLLWSYESAIGAYTSVASNERAIAGMYSNGTFYVSIPVTDQLVAFDANSGAVRWSLHTLAPVKMSPVVSDGSLYFGDTVGMLYVVDARTGGIRYLDSMKSPFTTSPPVIVGRTLVIANGDRILAIPLADLQIAD